MFDITKSAYFPRDNVEGRTLSAATYVDPDNMTVESCIAFCDAGPYVYAGVEWSQVSSIVGNFYLDLTYTIMPRNVVCPIYLRASIVSSSSYDSYRLRKLYPEWRNHHQHFRLQHALQGRRL
jgi:hypothetical protein